MKKFLKILSIFFGINFFYFLLLTFFTEGGKYEMGIIILLPFRIIANIFLVLIPSAMFSLIYYYVKNDKLKYALLVLAYLFFIPFLYFYLNP